MQDAIRAICLMASTLCYLVLYLMYGSKGLRMLCVSRRSAFQRRVRLPLAACMRLYCACSVLHAHVVWKTAQAVSVEGGDCISTASSAALGLALEYQLSY